MAYLHKTAGAKIPDRFRLIHKLLILCLFEVSKTVFILKGALTVVGV